MEEIIKKAKELSQLIDNLKDNPSKGSCILLIFNEAGDPFAKGNIKGHENDLIATISSICEATPRLTDLLLKSI